MRLAWVWAAVPIGCRTCPWSRKMVSHRSHRLPKEPRRIGRQAQPTAVKTGGSIGALSNQNKAIIGGAGLLAAVAIAFALLHHPQAAAPNNNVPHAQTGRTDKTRRPRQMDKTDKTHPPKTHRPSRAGDLVPARRPARADSWQRTPGSAMTMVPPPRSQNPPHRSRSASQW